MFQGRLLGWASSRILPLFQSILSPSIEHHLTTVPNSVLLSYLPVLHQNVGDTGIVEELPSDAQGGDARPRFDVDDVHRGFWDNIEKLEQVGCQSNKEASGRSVGEDACRVPHPGSNVIGGRRHESWKDAENAKKCSKGGGKERLVNSTGASHGDSVVGSRFFAL